MAWLLRCTLDCCIMAAQRQGCAQQCKLSGQWLRRWLKSAMDWNAHLERPRNGASWPAQLLHYKDRKLFINRRMSLLPCDGYSGSCLAGRTETRARRGRIYPRWHDGIEFAEGRS